MKGTAHFSLRLSLALILLGLVMTASPCLAVQKHWSAMGIKNPRAQYQSCVENLSVSSQSKTFEELLPEVKALGNELKAYFESRGGLDKIILANSSGMTAYRTSGNSLSEEELKAGVVAIFSRPNSEVSAILEKFIRTVFLLRFDGSAARWPKFTSKVSGAAVFGSSTVVLEILDSSFYLVNHPLAYLLIPAAVAGSVVVAKVTKHLSLNRAEAQYLKKYLVELWWHFLSQAFEGTNPAINWHEIPLMTVVFEESRSSL